MSISTITKIWWFDENYLLYFFYKIPPSTPHMAGGDFLDSNGWT